MATYSRNYSEVVAGNRGDSVSLSARCDGNDLALNGGYRFYNTQSVWPEQLLQARVITSMADLPGIYGNDFHGWTATIAPTGPNETYGTEAGFAVYVTCAGSAN
jgi:hypothetical protein